MPVTHKALFQAIEDGAINDMSSAEAAEFGYQCAMDRVFRVMNAISETLEKDGYTEEEARHIRRTFLALGETLNQFGQANTTLVNDEDTGKNESYH